MTTDHIINMQKIISEKEALKHYNNVLKERLRKNLSQLVEARKEILDGVPTYQWDSPRIYQV